MIYIGYQGIGKSSISGNKNIDLESSNFWVDNERVENWFKIYCNIAEHLSNQGFNVFMSSHKIIREEFNRRGTKFITICPCLELKDKWLKRLEERYNKSKSEKNLKALKNAEQCYEENIIDLMQEDEVINIQNIDYNLEDLLYK